MAKIQNLSVETLKIADEAITIFDSPSTSTTLAVSNPLLAPVVIWFGAEDPATSGGLNHRVNLYRTSGTLLLATCRKRGRKLGIDREPVSTSETYYVSNAAGSGTAVIFGAMVLLK